MKSRYDRSYSATVYLSHSTYVRSFKKDVTIWMALEDNRSEIKCMEGGSSDTFNKLLQSFAADLFYLVFDIRYQCCLKMHLFMFSSLLNIILILTKPRRNNVSSSRLHICSTSLGFDKWNMAVVDIYNERKTRK